MGEKSVQEEFLGEKYLGEESLGEKSVQEEFLGEESLGEKYMGEKYVQEKKLGEESLCEKYMGEKSVQEEFLGEKYLGEKYMGEMYWRVSGWKVWWKIGVDGMLAFVPPFSGLQNKHSTQRSFDGFRNGHKNANKYKLKYGFGFLSLNRSKLSSH